MRISILIAIVCFPFVVNAGNKFHQTGVPQGVRLTAPDKAMRAQARGAIAQELNCRLKDYVGVAVKQPGKIINVQLGFKQRLDSPFVRDFVPRWLSNHIVPNFSSYKATWRNQDGTLQTVTGNTELSSVISVTNGKIGMPQYTQGEVNIRGINLFDKKGPDGVIRTGPITMFPFVTKKGAAPAAAK